MLLLLLLLLLLSFYFVAVVGKRSVMEIHFPARVSAAGVEEACLSQGVGGAGGGGEGRPGGREGGQAPGQGGHVGVGVPGVWC